MPDVERYPRWGRIIIRTLVTAIYAIVCLLATNAVLHAPLEVVALVGLNATLVVAAITAVSSLLATLAHAAHLWLVERAVVLFILTGAGALDAILWVQSTRSAADADAAALLLIVVLFLVIRFVQLEVFAVQNRRPRRRRKVV